MARPLKNLISILGYLLTSGCLFILASCSESGESARYSAAYKPKYASGFEVLTDSISGQTKVVVTKLWQGNSDDQSGRRDSLVFKAPLQRIVATSSTHVAMLAELGELNKLVGVSGLKYISNPDIKKAGLKITDIGYDSSLDYEKITALKPDIVLLYGVEGASPLEKKLKELGIPTLYIGDYLEQSPVGKTEWIVAIGALIGKRMEAEAYIDSVAGNYMKLRELAIKEAASTGVCPTVLFNTPYGDSWYMPSSDSYLGQLARDAGAKYQKDSKKESVPVSMEEALLMASQSDFWLNVGSPNSLDDLQRELPKFAGSKPIVKGNIYNNTLRTTPGGGNDFYESGALHPDILLSDLITIFHPTLIPGGHKLFYYKRLQ